MKSIVCAGVAALVAGAAVAKTESELKQILDSMTLEEKVGQLCQLSSGGTAGAAESEAFEGTRVPKKVAALVKNAQVGSLLGACGVENFNALQKIAMEEARVAIPLMVGHDMIHGVMTQLPIPLGQSCTWNADLWRRTGELIAHETPVKGCNWTFAPMVDIARDPRWGRIAEGGGQDPLLTSRMGAALVAGIQTKDVAMPVAACVKHYAAYGAACAGRDYNEVEMSESTFRNVYLPPFRACVDAGVMTVMPAFNTLNGVPCSVNKWLLTDILRGELGFTGFVISDYDAIAECVGPDHHGVAVDAADVAVQSLTAGMDQEMMSTTFHDTLAASVRAGRVSEEVINARVMNILRIKNALGLWEHPYIDTAAVEARIDRAAHAAFAREVAAKSCVLLKNENGTLPLKAGAKVLLVGPGADDLWHTVGCWASWVENSANGTLLEGLTADGVDYMHVKGYGFREGPVEAEAIREAAAQADVILALFGEKGGDAGEGKSECRIELPEVQLEALKVLKATGKPLVAVLMNGRPLAIPELAVEADAILEAWNPGTSGGWGVADVLTGKVNPSGRLTTVIPYATGQLPLFYNATRTGRPGSRTQNYTSRYIDGHVEPLYTFGYGLSYTTFAYANEAVSVVDGLLVFTADITNTGAVAGTETVQVYTRTLNGVESRPVRELRDWRQVTLQPGETARVEMKVPVTALDYWCGSRKTKATGAFHAWIAPNAAAGKLLQFSLAD